MRRKIIIVSLLLVIIASAASLILCDRVIRSSAQGRMYSDTDSIPYRRTGLLLGTNKYIANKYINPYYLYRIQAAAALLRSGKITYIIVSGDNSRRDYDESSQMRADLIAEGVDSTHIYMDFAGFRTFDSMVRAREIFGQDSVTIISQPFHNERALYIASREGISAIAFNAHDVSKRAGLYTMTRERFARVKVFVDYLIGKKPKYLGDKIVIG
jgi:SanA protein